MKSPDEYTNRLESTLFHPIFYSTKGFYALVAVLGLTVLWAGYAWSVQLRQGLVVTGLRDVVIWGFYITNFVFFIGISHAGTLISAILRVTHVPWRTSVTRVAEVITVVALMTGASMIIIDMGRPDRVLNLFKFGRIQSPLVWDLLAVITYLTGSLIYLYLPLIPDIARLRDRVSNRMHLRELTYQRVDHSGKIVEKEVIRASAFKRFLYTTMAVGWRDTPTQKRRLERAISIMSILIIPIAVSVHTVVSWVFAMTVRVGWNSTIFGPYFVVGAIFSGIASLIIAMALFRKFLHLEEYITVKQFQSLGFLLLALNAIYLYFTAAEYLTVGYKLAESEKQLLSLLFVGQQAPLFWGFVLGGLLVPGLMIALPWTRNIPGIIAASVLVNVGMWLKRFVIIVPSLQVPLMPYDFGVYRPTWVEWSITAGAFAGFSLLYVLFAKVFPIVSFWEMAEDRARVEEAVAAAVEKPASILAESPPAGPMGQSG